MSELDDFFAKKDRKKSKGKKFLGVEEKGKGKSDDSSKNKEKGVKKERVPREDGEEGTIPEQEADEWREFEEEKKDYTGLKLGHLSISNNPAGEGGNSGVDIGDDGGSQDGGDGEDGGQDGDGNTNEGSCAGKQHQHHSGPWKRVDQHKQKDKVVVEQKENGQPEKVQHDEEPPKRSTGTYVPPSMRNQQLRGSSQSSSGGGSGRELQPMRMRGARAAAPDIHNEDYFPTLAAGGPGGVTTKDKQGAFELVSHGRGGSGNSASHARGGPTSGAGLRSTSSTSSQQLTLGNRFNTLSHNDS